MKRTQLKDALRNIRKQIVPFLSIIAIAFLGTATFLGIDYSVTALRRNGSELYNSLNFRDIEIVSTRLFSERDLEDLRREEGAADVEPVWQVGAKASSEGERRDVNVISLTERLNRPEVKEGRFPEDASECGIEESLADEMGWKTGSRIRLTDASGGKVQYLGTDEVTVTGIIAHPDHTNLNVPETPYVLVVPEAFDHKALRGCFMKAEIRIEKDADADRFSERYETRAGRVLARLEELAAVNALRRDGEVLAQMREELESGWTSLEDVKESIRGAMRRAVEDVAGEAAGLIPWEGRQAVQVDDEDTTAMDVPIAGGYRFTLGKSLTEYVQEFIDSGVLTEEVLKEAFGYLTDPGKPFDTDAAKEALLVYLASAMESEGYGEEYEALLDACSRWDAGHAEYLRSVQAGREGRAVTRWLVLDGRGNASFVQLILGSGNLSSLEGTFALLFIVVGALVIFATVSKMVEEQRTLVGTTKALGFYRREIFAKYLLFGTTATVLGTIIGILVARFGMEGFVLRSYNNYYVFDITRTSLFWKPTLLVLAAGILLSAGAVAAACLKLLREPAIRLMQPKVPEGAKKAGAGLKRLTLYSRLILLNIYTDLRRVSVTVVSVAGCCALIIIAVTMRFAVNGSMKLQYSTVVDYDVRVNYDPSVSRDAGEQVRRILRDAGAEYAEIYSSPVTYRITDNQVAELLCGDLEEIGKRYHLLDWKTGEPLAPAENGILIQRRLAEIYGLEPGSEFEIAIGGTKNVTVRVAGIFEHYIGRPMVMSRASYEEVSGEPWVSNAFLVSLDGAAPESLEEELRGVEGFEGTVPSDTDKAVFESATGMINTLVGLFIFMAAVMAGVVLMNLTNMYVLQKKRELTIMRINGFTVKEVTGYMVRETVLTTILGIILGIAAGSGIAYRIIRSMEQPFFRFDRSVSVPAWLIAAGLTALFTVLVNMVALRPVRHLKLTDMNG